MHLSGENKAGYSIWLPDGTVGLTNCALMSGFELATLFDIVPQDEFSNASLSSLSDYRNEQTCVNSSSKRYADEYLIAPQKVND